MQLFVPPSMLEAATAALTGIETCRVSVLPAAGQLTGRILRQGAGAERCVGVWRGAVPGDLPQQLVEVLPRVLQIERGELDAAVMFSCEVLPAELRQRVPAGLRALLQRWSSEDLLLCCGAVFHGRVTVVLRFCRRVASDFADDGGTRGMRRTGFGGWVSIRCCGSWGRCWKAGVQSWVLERVSWLWCVIWCVEAGWIHFV